MGRPARPVGLGRRAADQGTRDRYRHRPQRVHRGRQDEPVQLPGGTDPGQLSRLPGHHGRPYIDYLIADRVVVPENDRPFYTEKIVWLPNSYQVNDNRRPIGDVPTRTAAGLPPSGFVFCCFNNTYKITRAMFDIWMRILRRVEGSVLWLFESNTDAADNLRREAVAHQVDAERLIFAARVPQEAHLAELSLADLFLDTLPYNAHTTASDALWAGVPVYNLPGQHFRRPGRGQPAHRDPTARDDRGDTASL